MMKRKIIPSIIAKFHIEVKDMINKVKDYADTIQLDVMDGKFVPNKSFNFDFALPETGCKFEAHLMVNEPEEWIEEYGDKVDTIIVHSEVCRDCDELISIIKERGKRAGIALNPNTPVDRVVPYLDKIDQVLVMTVEPGAYGGRFLPEALEKVRKIREMNNKIDIEVDGGINPNTVTKALDAGANLFVVGSFIMRSKEPEEAYALMEELVE